MGTGSFFLRDINRKQGLNIFIWAASKANSCTDFVAVLHPTVTLYGYINVKML